MKPKQLNIITNNSELFIMTVYVPSGSVYENIGDFKNKNVSGISHFIEHLLFKHTQKFTGKEVLQNFTKLGGFYNASTDKDQTMFYVKTLAENYVLATELLYEIVLKPRFQKNEVKMELKVVLEELSQTKDDYDDILYKGSSESIFHKDNIYLPLVIGNKNDLQNISFNTLWKYYCERFQRMLVVVNCDVKYVSRVKTHIFNKFFHRHRKNIIRTVHFDEPELQRLSQQFHNKIIVDTQNTVQYNTCLTFVAYPFAQYKNNIILDFIKFCLTDAGLYSVLSYAIREKRGLVYSIKGSNEKMRYIGVFRIYFGTSNKDVGNIMRVVISILQDLKSKGLTNEVLDFYKTSYLNHVQYKFANEEYRASWHGDNIFYGVDISEVEYIDSIRNITNDNIKDVCKQVFEVSQMAVYSFGNYFEKNKVKDNIQQTLRDAL